MCGKKGNVVSTRVNKIDGLAQDCNISSVLAMEILQSGTKPFKYDKNLFEAPQM